MAPARLSVDDRDCLVTDHVDLIQHVVNQVSTRYPRHVDRQELWNAGALGLVDASRRYDPQTGIPFARYAMIRIRGAVIDSTRSRDWATRAVRRGMRNVRRTTETFAQEHGRQPSTAEIAAAMGVDEDQVLAYRRAAMTTSLLHLDQRVAGTSTDEATLADIIEDDDREVLPEGHLEHRELLGTLRTAIDHLPDVQRDVIERYYFEGHYLRQIADGLGVTEARVSQIRSEALNAIRAYFRTEFDGVREVAERAPGRRARTLFVDTMTDHVTWRARLEAADRCTREMARAG